MEELSERNNADALAKGIALVQILWFALQVVGRLIQNSAVTLLEVHTTINVGCAITLFALWFKKPYNLTRPVFVRAPDATDIINLFSSTRFLGKYLIRSERITRLNRPTTENPCSFSSKQHYRGQSATEITLFRGYNLSY